MSLNAKYVNRSDEKWKKSGGLKISGIRITPKNNVLLFDIKLKTNKSNTEIINKGIELLHEKIKKDGGLDW